MPPSLLRLLTQPRLNKTSAFLTSAAARALPLCLPQNEAQACWAWTSLPPCWLLLKKRRPRRACPLRSALARRSAWNGIANASFDVVTAALVPYLADPPAALQRWKQVLRPAGGRVAFHGFRDASILEALATRAAAAVDVPLNFEQWTGSAEACAQLARDAGFSDVKVQTIPIVDKHSADDAKAALNGMLANPLCEPLASACRDDAQLFDRLQAAYDPLVYSSVAADGFLHTRGECYIVVGFA